ncbi:MAG: TMEM143 family protein [Pseudomonadota bacterium]
MLDQIFHYEFHQVIEALKISYAEMDPDSDTRASGLKSVQPEAAFIDLLDELLEKANYERITQEDLNQALNESSIFKIRLHVDFDDFNEVSLFARGESLKTETVNQLFGLRKRQIDFVNYDRVVVFIRLRDDLETSHSSSPLCRPGSTLLKLFRNVPKADLEMLFPNTQVRMRLTDKLLIGVPAVISGGIVVSTKLGASLLLLGSLMGYWLGLHQQPTELNQAAIMALLAGLAALGGYLWKQFNNFKNRKLRFMQALTQNLYFKNLDNNAGVFHRLANDAEEEESKEALLAYCFLLCSKQSMDKAALDQSIENWFENRWQCKLNFEIDDALQKLLTLGLVNDEEGRLTAVPLIGAIQKLDARWDNYFTAPSSQ